VPIGQVLDDPALLARLKVRWPKPLQLRGRSIALLDIEALTLDQMRQFPPSSKPSMLEDMEADDARAGISVGRRRAVR